MKRKAIKVGQGTLTVSLPIKWTKRFNVKAGDELNIEEDRARLIIDSNFSEKEGIKRIDLSLHEFNRAMLNRVVAACYKAGYNEIIIEYSNSKDLEIIQKTVERTYMGYDLEYLKNNKVKISSLSKLDVKKFEDMERKLFLSIKNLVAELVLRVREKKLEDIEQLALMDKQIDMYSDFCRRIINQGFIPKSNPMCSYYLYEQLEIIADAFKDIISIICNKNSFPKEFIPLLDTLKTFFDQLYDAYYKFSVQKTGKFCDTYQDLTKKIKNISCSKETQELYALFYFIIRSLFETKSALLTMRLK